MPIRFTFGNKKNEMLLLASPIFVMSNHKVRFERLANAGFT
jgi:hypothetical protein